MSTSRTAISTLQPGCIALAAVAKRPATDQKSVGERIVLLRRAKGGMMQKTLAQLMGRGMTPQKLWNYESGQDMIPVPAAIDICLATGSDLDYIFRGITGQLPPDLQQKLAELGEEAKTKSLKRA